MGWVRVGLGEGGVGEGGVGRRLVSTSSPPEVCQKGLGKWR